MLIKKIKLSGPEQIAIPRTEGCILRPKYILEREKCLGKYQEQTCYTNCGDVYQKKSPSFDFEVNLNCYLY